MNKEPKSLISTLLGIMISFAAAMFLLRFGIYYLLDVWPVIAIIVTLIAVGIVIYRIWKSKNDTKW